jgi:predicted Zn-dependent protease
LFPTNSDGWTARIKIYLKQNQDAKAKADVDALLARFPKLPMANYFKAVLLSRAHDKQGAAQAIQSLPPEFVKRNPEYGVQMAQIAMDNGATEAGAAILGSALSVQPDLVEARLKLASLRMSQDSPQSALVLLNPVQDSKDPRIQKLLRQVRAKIAKDRAF